MGTGHITGYFDVAQIALYAFWFFLGGLVIYLRREDRREGYPLVDAGAAGARADVNAYDPGAKKYALDHPAHPNGRPPERVIAAVPTAGFPGAPLTPTGNPLIDGVGPAAWANRADVPDLTFDEGLPKIVPLRVATDFHVAEQDETPIGYDVVGADGEVGATVCDLWLDRSEMIFRYLEVVVPVGADRRNVLVPMPLAVISARRRTVTVRSLLAAQFADIPMTKNPDQITLLEEDRVCAYVGGGNLYATPDRLEPLL